MIKMILFSVSIAAAVFSQPQCLADHRFSTARRRRCRSGDIAAWCTVARDGVGLRDASRALATLRCASAHYRPSKLCLLKGTVLQRGGAFELDGVMAASLPASSPPPLLLPKGDLGEIFSFTRVGSGANAAAAAAAAATERCRHVVLGAAVAFTLPYHFGRLNYYHLHYDVLIPLHALLIGPLGVRAGRDGREIVSLVEAWSSREVTTLMPAVEHGVFYPQAAKGVEWSTRLFATNVSSSSNTSNTPLWREALEGLYGPRPIVPLSTATLDALAPLCFERLMFGLPKVEHGNAALLRSYAEHARARFAGDVAPGRPSPTRPRVGFVVRSGRRRVLNVDALLEVCAALGGGEWECERVDFDGMTLGEQVRRVQGYSVLVGMQGAGMINGLWLPRGAAALVLFQMNP